MIATSATERSGLNAFWTVVKWGETLFWIMRENKGFSSNEDFLLSAGNTARDMCELTSMCSLVGKSIQVVLLSAYFQSTSPSICGHLCTAHSYGSHYSLCAQVDVPSGTNMNTCVLYALSCIYKENHLFNHFLFLWYIAVFPYTFSLI